MKNIHDKEKCPLYLQLYSRLRDDIVAGNYAYNAKLPSKRSLAEKTGVSTVTVEHAYALLCEEGYAEAKERSGYVAVFRSGDEFSVAEGCCTEYPACGTEYAYPKFPLSVIGKTMRKVLAEHGELLLEKSPNSGCMELREAIRRYLARNRDIRVKAEQIVIGSGSEYLYGLLIELLGRHRIYAIETNYTHYAHAHRACPDRHRH